MPRMAHLETERRYITAGYSWQPTREDLLVTEVGRNMWGLTFPRVSMSHGVDSPNIWVVAGTKGTVIIDTSFGYQLETQSTRILARELGHKALLGIILTHRHSDHSGGVRKLRTRRRVEVPVIAAATAFLPDSIDLGNKKLKLIETPGHTQDSICIFDEQERVLFTGDTILGSLDTVTVEEDGMGDYFNSLKRIYELNPKIICPGHGPVIHDTKEKIVRVFLHRAERHEQIFAQIASGNTKVEDIEETLYPEESWGLAEEQIQSHINLLLKQGRIREDGDTFIVAS